MSENIDFVQKIITWGTILQRYKTGNEKVTNILSDQTIPRFVVSHFYSIFNPKVLGSWKWVIKRWTAWNLGDHEESEKANWISQSRNWTADQE